MNHFFQYLIYTGYFIAVIGLAGYGFHRLTILYLYLKHRNDQPEPSANFEELPLVTFQLPCFNEKHVIKRLIKSVSEVDYPKDKLEIQVLDDSTDETVDICRAEVEKLQELGFDAVHIHRTDRAGFKAGALEAGTLKAKGEFLFILDSDFIVHSDILQKTIHYFTDDKIGLIQTRWAHLNRNYNMLTRIQAMFLDGHLELEQTARNRSGRFFTFNGTGGMWRKSCILDAGGWDHDTLTEDMDLSYRAQLNGWKFIFLNKVETPAELPVDMDGFKNQQHRWTKGSIQVCKKILVKIWKSDAPLAAKMEATAHLTSNFAYLILFVLLFLIMPKQNVYEALPLVAKYPWLDGAMSLPVFFFGSVSVVLFYLMAQKAIQPKNWWKEVIYLPLLLALGIGMSLNNAKAVMEAILGHQSGFVRTPKYGIGGGKEKSKGWKSSNYKAIKSLMPFLELAFGLFFVVVIFNNIILETYVTAVLLLPFPIGFFYTSLSSISQMLPSFKSTQEVATVEIRSKE